MIVYVLIFLKFFIISAGVRFANNKTMKQTNFTMGKPESFVNPRIKDDWRKNIAVSLFSKSVTRERILKRIKQGNKNFIKNIIVFFLNNFIWTNMKFKTKLYLVQIESFNKKTIIFLMRFLFLCLIVFKIRSQLYLGFYFLA